jgi:hypothetical protein
MARRWLGLREEGAWSRAKNDTARIVPLASNSVMLDDPVDAEDWQPLSAGSSTVGARCRGGARTP